MYTMWQISFPIDVMMSPIVFMKIIVYYNWHEIHGFYYFISAHELITFVISSHLSVETFWSSYQTWILIVTKIQETSCKLPANFIPNFLFADTISWF